MQSRFENDLWKFHYCGVFPKKVIPTLNLFLGVIKNLEKIRN